MNILDLSKRTVSKICGRLKLSCSNCGWNKTVCDIHHIKPKSKGGSDEHDNLTYLCPNCHRLAHNNKLTKFISLVEQIGDTWKDVYFPEKAGYISEERKQELRIQIESARNIKDKKYKETSTTQKTKLLASNVDYTKRGWVTEVSKIIDISPQKVSGWMKRNAPEIYIKCNIRKVPVRK